MINIYAPGLLNFSYFFSIISKLRLHVARKTDKNIQATDFHIACKLFQMIQHFIKDTSIKIKEAKNLVQIKNKVAHPLE